MRVKLSQEYLLEESFDPGTIIQINSFSVDDEYEAVRSYKVNITVLASDYKNNKSVANKEWYDKDSNPCLNIFEHEILMRPSFNPEKDNWNQTIYVMEGEEAFMEIKDMPRKTFVEMCRAILRFDGELVSKHCLHFFGSYKGDSDLLKYEDDEIIIVGTVYDLALCITRKENNNPVVYADEKGAVFRSHGEQSHLFGHVRNLILEKI
jgi:hypothetical protein